MQTRSQDLFVNDNANPENEVAQNASLLTAVAMLEAVLKSVEKCYYYYFFFSADA